MARRKNEDPGPFELAAIPFDLVEATFTLVDGLYFLSAIQATFSSSFKVTSSGIQEAERTIPPSSVASLERIDGKVKVQRVSFFNLALRRYIRKGDGSFEKGPPRRIIPALREDRERPSERARPYKVLFGHSPKVN